MICVSLSNMDYAACSEALEAYPFVEFRFDLLPLGRHERKQLVRKATRSISTCRPGRYTEEERIEILGDAIGEGGTYVDLEMDAPETDRRRIVQLARQNETGMIISYHNFEKTPGWTELLTIIDRAAAMGADIIKLACKAETSHDAARLMACYREDRQLVSLGMGAAGLITRIAAPFLGAAFTFAAPGEGMQTAPGQMTFDVMASIIAQIEQANQ